MDAENAAAESIRFNGRRHDPQQCTVFGPDGATHRENRFSGNPSYKEFADEPVLPFRNLSKIGTILQIDANVGSNTRGDDHSGRIYPVQAANRRIIGSKLIEYAAPILIGNRSGSRQGQPERQFVMDETMQKCLEIYRDSTGKLQVGLQFTRFALLKPAMKDVCFQKEEGDKDDGEEQNHPLFDRHPGSEAEGIFHKPSCTLSVD